MRQNLQDQTSEQHANLLGRYECCRFIGAQIAVARIPGQATKSVEQREGETPSESVLEIFLRGLAIVLKFQIGSSTRCHANMAAAVPFATTDMNAILHAKISPDAIKISPKVLLAMIGRSMEESGFRCERAAGRLMVTLYCPRRRPLSPMQEKVLRLAADAKTDKEIAAALRIAPETVHTHITRGIRALGAHGRADALARARARGLLRDMALEQPTKPGPRTPQSSV
jgi:DNA-binding CsgD family transcriptional regulator